jgi:hypothetical protein
MLHQKVLSITAILLMVSNHSWSQDTTCEKPATIVLFRTFNPFSYLFSYKLYAGDRLLGRIGTHDVFIIDTYDDGISFQATTKAPSLNASKKSNYQKQKNIRYPFTLKPGEVYFVKCDFLNQRLFEYPRQPTLKLLKSGEEKKYLKRSFLRKKLKKHLFNEWLQEVGE